ncbi:MAG: hypothetical protein ABSH08_12405 [Tepidisphaeraceae bacterium]|jgi:hypothetical protein
MARLFQESVSPLEQFVRDYVEARKGAWDEIEPQVYDLLIEPDMIQVAFDPEALPEHPNAQLASLGSPLLDRLLGDAAERWSSSRFYRIGLNLQPYGLESRLRRAISLPPAASLAIEKVRAMNCPQALFWFKATFASDQKEEEILPIGIDLHYLREVRHLEFLLASNRLSEEPEAQLPEAPHGSLSAGYRAARRQAAPTVASLANARRREWTSRVEKQIARMSAYYAQLHREADEQAARTEDWARAAARREAIDREERLRIAELRQKSAIHVRVKLASVMVVQQPKLLLSTAVFDKNRRVGRWEILWDPLSEAVEAVPCPACGQPTFDLRIDRNGLRCANCAGHFARKDK